MSCSLGMSGKPTAPVSRSILPPSWSRLMKGGIAGFAARKAAFIFLTSARVFTFALRYMTPPIWPCWISPISVLIVASSSELPLKPTSTICPAISARLAARAAAGTARESAAARTRGNRRTENLSGNRMAASFCRLITAESQASLAAHGFQKLNACGGLSRLMRHEDVVACALADDAVRGWRQRRERGGMDRPFQHDAIAGRGERRLHQLTGVGIVADSSAQQPHLLLYQRRIAAWRVHRIDQHHLWMQTRQKLSRVPDQKSHPADDLRLRPASFAGARQPFFEQRRHLGRALDQHHLGAERGQQEGIASEAGRGIHDAWRLAAHEAGGSRQRLSAPATEAVAVAHRAADEIHDQVPGHAASLRRRQQCLRGALRSMPADKCRVVRRGTGSYDGRPFRLTGLSYVLRPRLRHVQFHAGRDRCRWRADAAAARKRPEDRTERPL